MANFYESDIYKKVISWARENALEDFRYGTPYSYWRAALENNICSQDEYDNAERVFGERWHYRGD